MRYEDYTLVLAKRARGLLCGLLFMQSSLAVGASLGQIDNFSDGTLQNWAMGRPTITDTHMANVSSGGPAGTGDAYLQVTSDNTAVAGGRPTFFNQTQWTGDYLAAGITAISMDLKNFSSTEPLQMWLALEGGPDALTGGLFASSTSVVLNSGGDWTHVVFSLAPSDLVAVSGRSGVTGNDVLAALGNVVELRLLHSPTADWNGIPVGAVLGIDNIEAVVPLPSALWLLGSGLLGLLLPARRPRRL